MGDRRKRKSLWDVDEETRHFSRTSEQSSWAGKEHHFNDDDGRYHEYSSSRNYSNSKPRDQSGQPYCESIDEGSIAPIPDTFIRNRQNCPEGKDIGGGSRYFHDMSPGFDGVERHKYDHSRETTGNHYQRYLEEGRSRSRSRSRTRGRSRSRSLSRGRARERAWSKSRSRSRSRSREDGGAAGQMRSRSPIGDSRQSHAWNDRRSLPGKSSPICRDFAAGRCRNGSQCRFFHSNGTNRGDGEHVGDDTTESWKSRADSGHVSKHVYGRGPGSDLENDFSDPYRGAEEQFQTKSRRAIPCKDFVKGKCRWGDTCRFSHHLSSDETFGKGPRYSSFDTDIERQSFREGKPFCKFFAVGKCERDNCRFFHEDPKIDRVDGRRGAAIDERKNASRWGHSLENENKVVGIPEWTDASINRDKQLGPPGGTSSYSRVVGTLEPISEEHTANKGETPLLQKLQWQNQEGIMKGEMQKTLQEQDISMKTWQQNKSPGRHFQLQDHGVPETAFVSSYRPDIVDEVKNSRSTSHSIVFSGKNQSQDVGEVLLQNSSISNEPDRPQNIYCPKPSNGFGVDSNNPETHLVHSLNMLFQMQNNQKAVQMAEILATKVPHIFPNLLNSEQCTQLANAPVAIASQGIAPLGTSSFPFQRVDNEQSGANANPDASSARGMMASISNPNIVEANPARVSYDLKHLTENGTGANEDGNHAEQNNQMQQLRSSPLSIIGLETASMRIVQLGSPKFKQEKEIGKFDASEVSRAANEERKGVVENKQPEALDEVGKSEEGLTNKDDKGMRLFKNSLVEVVKDILKPTWKEGRMSRDIHKTIVKKVVDKVTSTIQMDHIPKTQEKIDQYLSSSKPKISKLVQAYVGRSLKKDS